MREFYSDFLASQRIKYVDTRRDNSRDKSITVGWHSYQKDFCTRHEWSSERWYVPHRIQSFAEGLSGRPKWYVWSVHTWDRRSLSYNDTRPEQSLLGRDLQSSRSLAWYKLVKWCWPRKSRDRSKDMRCFCSDFLAFRCIQKPNFRSDCTHFTAIGKHFDKKNICPGYERSESRSLAHTR